MRSGPGAIGAAGAAMAAPLQKKKNDDIFKPSYVRMYLRLGQFDCRGQLGNSSSSRPVKIIRVTNYKHVSGIPCLLFYRTARGH